LGNIGTKTRAPEFVNERVQIDWLEKAWAKRAMNLHREADDLFTKRVVV